MALDWAKANRRDQYRKASQRGSQELPATYNQLCYLQSLLKKRNQGFSYAQLQKMIPSQREASTLIQKLKSHT